ncbi:MAG: hypothetical protein ACLUOI_13350 [Eisenbergiella sp.]
MVNDGDVVQQGTHEELIRRTAFYRQMYLAQFEKNYITITAFCLRASWDARPLLLSAVPAVHRAALFCKRSLQDASLR